MASSESAIADRLPLENIPNISKGKVHEDEAKGAKLLI